MTHQSPVTARHASAAIALVPLLLVNAVAFTGQLAFLHDHMSWPLAGDIAFAGALESIAVYLAYHAHVALLANDSALRLRLAAYGFALLIAGMNYSHYSHDWRPTFAALAVGLMSASSPWLWGVHSRRASRDALMAAGMVEPHALRLGGTRWLWHPVRSARVMYHATWSGDRHLETAIAAIEPRPVADSPDDAPEPASGQLSDEHAVILAHADSDAARIRYASRVLATDKPSHVGQWLRNRGYDVAGSNIRSVLRRERDAGSPIALPASPRAITADRSQ